MNKYFTFQNKENSWKQIVNFIFNISICYIVSYGLAKPIVYSLLASYSMQIRDNFSMVVGMCLFVGLNYLGQRFIVFKNNK